MTESFKYLSTLVIYLSERPLVILAADIDSYEGFYCVLELYRRCPNKTK